MIQKTQKRLSLKSNFIYNFISQLLVLLVPLITAPYLARVLGEEGNGEYAYAMSIVTYFMLFASWGFDVYGQRKTAEYQDDRVNRDKTFFELLILKSVFTAVSLAVLYSLLFTVGFGEKYFSLILIMSVQVIAVPFDIQFYFRGEEDFRSITLRTVVMRLAALIFTFVFVRGENDNWIYAICISGSTLLANLSMWPSAIRKVSVKGLGRLSLKKHLLPTLLIFLPALASTVYTTLDKSMIVWLYDPQYADYQNGCYDQAYKINSIVLLLVTVISSVMVSRNAHEYKSGNVEGVKKNLDFAFNYVWMMGIPLIVGFMVLSDNLSSWFLGEGYDEVPTLLRIMSVRYVFSGFIGVLGEQLFIAIGKEKYPTVATFVSATINLVLNFALIPAFGAVGAAITTAISEVTVPVILAIFAVRGKYISVLKILSRCWKYAIAAAIMLVPIYFMNEYMPYEVWTFIVITLVGIITYALALFALRDKFFLNIVKTGFNMIKGVFRKSSHRDGQTQPPERQEEQDGE